MSIISERLKEIRKKYKFNQDVMAEKCKVSLRSYCHYEAGERVPDADFFNSLAESLGIETAQYILFGIIATQQNDVTKPPANYAVLNKKRLDILMDDLTAEQQAEVIGLAEKNKRLNQCEIALEELKKSTG